MAENIPDKVNFTNAASLNTSSPDTSDTTSSNYAAPAVPDDTTSSTVTVPAATGSTTIATVSPTMEAFTTAGTKRTQPTRKRPKSSEPDDNEEFGTYIDSRGCEHRILQTGEYFYTATCKAKCRDGYHNARDGNPCLYALRRSARLNGNKKLCTMGTCKHGQCKGPFIGEVPCHKPAGTAQYYDEEDYYNHYYDYHDSSTGPNYYDDYDSKDYKDKPFQFAE
uniref:Evasin n=1 Tax=Amblyomma maculatum TaxID=34609 RepID=G3MSQ9_AMBMU